MAGVCWGKAFAGEHMAKMAAAVGALDLYPHAIGVGQVRNGAFYLLVEGRPAAVSIKLVDRAIELGVAAAANISAFLIEVIVLSRERPLRTLIFYNVTLFRRERVVARCELSGIIDLRFSSRAVSPHCPGRSHGGRIR